MRFFEDQKKKKKQTLLLIFDIFTDLVNVCQIYVSIFEILDLALDDKEDDLMTMFYNFDWFVS